MKMRMMSLLALTASLAAGPALAQDISPSVVFDMGGKFDRSFNEGIYNGVERFREETGISYAEFEVTNESQREHFQRRRLGEADRDHDVGAAARHAAQGLLALGFVGDLEFGVADAGFLAETLDAVIDPFIE